MLPDMYVPAKYVVRVRDTILDYLTSLVPSLGIAAGVWNMGECLAKTVGASQAILNCYYNVAGQELEFAKATFEELSSYIEGYVTPEDRRYALPRFKERFYNLLSNATTDGTWDRLFEFLTDCIKSVNISIHTK